MEQTTTTTTSRVSVIDELKKNIKRFFSKEYVRNSREDWIYSIVLKVLDATGTVKYTPFGDNHYLSNENYNYYVKISYQKIDIVCGNVVISEPCTPGFITTVQEDIRRAVYADTKKIEEKLDSQGALILKKLDDTLAQ